MFGCFLVQKQNTSEREEKKHTQIFGYNEFSILFVCLSYILFEISADISLKLIISKEMLSPFSYSIKVHFLQIDFFIIALI